MASSKIGTASSAVAAYFARIEAGTATPEEVQILPVMLERFGDVVPTASDGDKRVPEFGLVGPHDVLVMLGKKKLKHPAVMLIRMVKELGFPAPFRWERPYRWLIQDVKEYIDHERHHRAARR